MGISIELWRARIGSFGHKASNPSTLTVTVRCTRHKLVCVIAYLLIIGCVELNPGPPKYDIHVLEKRLDDFAIEVRATRTEAQQERQALNDQLGLLATETTRKLDALEASLNAAITRIATLERSLAAANATIAELKAAPVTATHPPAGTSAPAIAIPGSTSVTVLADELRERKDRSTNIVIFGIKTGGDDDDAVDNILSNELHLTVSATSVTRMGASSTARPSPPILVKFATAADAITVIRSAKNLRSSTNADIQSSVFISPDYTKLEREEQYKLRTELKRQKAAGGGDLIIRKGAIIPRPTPRVTP